MPISLLNVKAAKYNILISISIMKLLYLCEKQYVTLHDILVSRRIL
jgi:hypothetical protein